MTEEIKKILDGINFQIKDAVYSEFFNKQYFVNNESIGKNIIELICDLPKSEFYKYLLKISTNLKKVIDQKKIRTLILSFILQKD